MPSMTRRVDRFMPSCVAGALALGVVLSAQTPPAVPQTPQAPPPFRLATDLVRLDVSVLDKDRRPVRDLAASDFTIFENGKPQSVAAFSAVNLPEEAPPLAAPWMRDVALDVRDNSDAQQRRLFIIAIDDATIENDPKAVKSVKEIARGIVNRLGPSDLASVAFTRDNRHAQDFTADHARLLKAIDSFTLGFRGQGAAGVNAANFAAGGGGGRAAAGGTSAAMTNTTDDLWYLYSVGLLDRAVEYLTDVAERRKAIIYIGEGIPFDIAGVAGTFNATPGAASGGASDAILQGRIKEQMDDLFDRAQRANVTIYTVDACGLRSAPTPPVPGARASTATCVKGLDSDYLENVAVATGGRAVVNTNDFDPGLNAVFLENSTYYLLGFAPADSTRDGRFRTVEVKVNRPGLTVRTRSGYDAPRDAPADRPKPAASPLMKALAGVVPKSDLPMQITGAAFAYVGEMTADKPADDAAVAAPEAKKSDKKKDKKSDAPKPTASVLIAVGFKQPIRQSDERVVENVELQISAFDPDGRSYGNFHQRADVVIRPGSTGLAEYEVLGQIDLKPGRYQLRIAANLASFSDSGSVYYDIDVPDFANDPLTMSGLMLTSTPNPQFAPKNGLKPTVPIVPTTRRVFSPEYTAAAFARVYQGGKAKPAPATVRMSIRDEKNAVVIERKQDLPASLFSATRATDLQIDVPMKELVAGSYLLTIETTAGATTVRRDTRFTIAK